MENHRLLLEDDGIPNSLIESVSSPPPSVLRRLCAFRFANIVHLLRRFCYAFVPQLLRSLIWHDTVPAAKVFETSWLDGLRGLAAVSVFNFHHLFAFSDLPVAPFAKDDNHMWLVGLPIIRLGCAGLVAVLVFFVVAGYVCSRKALELMTKNEPAALLKSLSASVFRRSIRLMLPIFIITLIWAICAYIGLMEPLRPYINNKKDYFPGVFSESQLTRCDSLGEQLGRWIEDMRRLLNFWSLKPQYIPHDPHLWTVTYELKASYHLYLILLALARTRKWVRVGLLVVICFCYLLWDRWEIGLFFSGATLAQLDVIRAENRALTEKSDSRTATLPTLSSGVGSTYLGYASTARSCIGNKPLYVSRVLALILCLYLMSYPAGGWVMNAPGYETLNQFIPSFWSPKPKWWPSVGIVGLVAILCRSPPSSRWLRVLTHPWSLYMGKIMFAFYLVHGQILHMVGYGIPHAIWAYTGKETTLTYAFGIILGGLINLTLSLWAADVFTREVDNRCVKLLRWFEGACFVK